MLSRKIFKRLGTLSGRDNRRNLEKAYGQPSRLEIQAREAGIGLKPDYVKLERILG